MSLCLTDPASIADRRSSPAPFARLRQLLRAPAATDEAREASVAVPDPTAASSLRAPVNVLLL